MRAVDIFPWNDRFNTGLPEIDAQHRVLVGLLNELAGHIVSVTDFPDLNRILAELADYTVYHFASEDALWNRYITDEHERSVHRHWHENSLPVGPGPDTRLMCDRAQATLPVRKALGHQCQRGRRDCT